MWKKIKAGAKKVWLAIVAAVLAVAGFLGLRDADAQATPVVDVLSWTAPTQYVDGSAIPPGTITGYRIVWGLTPSGEWPPANTQDVGTVLTRTFTREETYGQRCYKVAALIDDANGLYTDAVCKEVQAPTREPGNLAVQ